MGAYVDQNCASTAARLKAHAAQAAIPFRLPLTRWSAASTLSREREKAIQHSGG
jgi:hypothetical protein